MHTREQAAAGSANLHMQDLHVYGHLSKRIPERSLGGLHLPVRKLGMIQGLLHTRMRARLLLRRGKVENKTIASWANGCPG